ncbi:MAG: deiodinase-like protein [Dehalococcoidia bacterium]
MKTAALGKTREHEHSYRYSHFTTRLLLADLRFSSRAPQPGEPFPAFDLAAIDGERLRSEELIGRPFVVILGSLTCPMTASAAVTLRELYERMGSAVTFVSVYAREAHPGEQIPQPRAIAEKLAHAQALAERDRYRWHVAVDDLDGTLHRLLDAKPNAAYVVDARGRIAFRSLWASDQESLRRALESVASGEQPRRRTSRAMTMPMMRALPWVDAIVLRAGRSASRDLWRAAPPMALMGKLGRWWRRSTPAA